MPSSTWRSPGGWSPTRPPGAGSSPATSASLLSTSWPAGSSAPPPARTPWPCGCPPGRNPRLRPRTTTSGWAGRPARWVGRFRVFDRALEDRHPAGSAHHRLAILAVRPDRQGHGIGGALLRAHHAALDSDGIPAYLEASDLRTRRLYRARGYTACGDPLAFPGAEMYPMVRQPRAAQPSDQILAGRLAGGAGPGPAPGGTR